MTGRPPNLLFVFSDEQRADTLATYGNHTIDMPHLNAFAQTATVFDRAYCTQPVCTPSRGSILTGLRPFGHGATTNNVPLNTDARTLVECLPEQTWRTGYVGKWHLGDEIFPQHGFDEWVSIEDEYIRWYGPGRDRSTRSSYFSFLAEQGLQPGTNGIFSRDRCARLPEPLTKPAFVADRSIDFLERHRGDPFVLYVNFLEPHMPFYGPRDGQYDPSEVVLPSNFDAPVASRWQEAMRRETFRSGQSGLPLTTEAEWRRMIANYWGLNSLVDTHVGRILTRLEQLGLAEDTIVVYTSDHGDMMGSHGLIAKGVMYEESVRVPLMLRLPGQTAGDRIDQVVSQIDLVPTLLDLLGVSYESTVFHGQSWCHKGDQLEVDPASRDVLIEWNTPELEFIDRKLYDTTSAATGDVKRSLMPHLKGLGTEAEMETVFRAARRCIITKDGETKLVLSQDGDHQRYDLSTDREERENRYGHDRADDQTLVRRALDCLHEAGDPAAELFETLLQ